ncbi:unnamed protein product [Moneuplotes crassus]|uniref:non-specific serine/threonine protein kinase n=1 Tax=Euplotes crassus TaxID=5936 RepID=A0AAD1XA25_EUPCR|nr:unnamed protein product [Moneuplotes crassus]
MEDLIYVDELEFDDEEDTMVLSQSQRKIIWEEKQRNFDINSVLQQFSLKKELFIIHKEEDIHNFYDIEDKILGEGSFGVVRRGADKDTGEIRAIKSIKKSRIRSKTRLLNELSTLKTLDHPNIVKLFEVYEDSESIHLVMEYCSGGELFDQILGQ